MSVELSSKCPMCNCPDMQLVDSLGEEIPNGDYDMPPEVRIVWLKEYCPECGFDQVKEPEQPCPDQLHDEKIRG